MSEEKLQELTKDLAELETLLGQASRQRTKDCLTIEKRKIETEIMKSKEVIANSQNADKATTPVTKPTTGKRYITEMKNYAWDQSDKFLKIFVSPDGAADILIPEENVKCEFTEHSMKLYVSDVNNRDYSLIINNLLEHINVEKSYVKAKKGMVTVFMKKEDEGKKWSHVTSTEKRVKESKKKEEMQDLAIGAEGGGDPGAGIMNVLKKMYDSGDPEMKRMIKKAWHEGQNKQSGDLSSLGGGL